MIKDGFNVFALVRNDAPDLAAIGVKVFPIGSLTPNIDLSRLMEGIDVVVHLVGRSHILKEKASDPMAEFRYVNVDCSLNLAEYAIKAGVKRFIYISSIKVNGETTDGRPPFTADERPFPVDPYGITKHEAELGLKLLVKNENMDLVIVRPPLVYGPKVKANFLSLIKLINLSIPLPFKAAKNRRSYVGISNLVALIVICICSPHARNETFLVSDGENLSIGEVAQYIGSSLGKKVFLYSVNIKFLQTLLRLLGLGSIEQRLFGSLEVDISKTKEMLGWSPSIKMDIELSDIASNF